MNACLDYKPGSFQRKAWLMERPGPLSFYKWKVTDNLPTMSSSLNVFTQMSYTVLTASTDANYKPHILCHYKNTHLGSHNHKPHSISGLLV